MCKKGFKRIYYELMLLILIALCFSMSTYGQKLKAEIKTALNTAGVDEFVAEENFRGNQVRSGSALLKTDEALTGEQIVEIEKLFKNFDKKPFPISITKISDANVYLFKSRGGGSTADLFFVFNELFRNKTSTVIIKSSLEPDLIIGSVPSESEQIVSDPLWGVDRIGVHKVWNKYQIDGDADQVIAEFDTGVYEHNDLAGKLWRSPASYKVKGQTLPCPTGSHGFNFLGLAGSSIQYLCSASDTSITSHGTAVAGIIGAKKGTRAHGVLQKVSIMPVKVLGSNAKGSIAAIIEGLRFVRQMKSTFDTGVKNKIRIVNISAEYAPQNPDPYWAIFEAELRSAEADGLMIISAAGNGKTNIDPLPPPPCKAPIFLPCFNLANGISVAASTPDVNEMIFTTSNWGKLTIPLAAPGSGVGTTDNSGPNAHRTFDETSAATPFVSGAAALVMTACPLLSNAEVKALLLAKADRNHADINNKVKNGRLDVYASIVACKGP